MYKRIINAWCMYDWANSAFATTVMAALFPPFYRSLALGAGFAENQATAYWAYTTSFALLAIALLAPALGAIADCTGGRKRYLAFFAALGVACTVAFILIGTHAWYLASILFIGANFGFAGANIFYESFLPHIATQGDIDQVSTRGYALGYVGGGILLVINLLWITYPGLFGMRDVAFAVRASFLSAAIWWALFSIPFFRRVPDLPAVAGRGSAVNPVKAGFSRLVTTFREIRRYRQLVIFLIAFWIYNDGIGTIIKMATAYGDEMGIGLIDMITALVITQFVGIPFAFLFGGLARKIEAKPSILLGLGVYMLICIAGYFMRSAIHFYILAFMIGMVQGGTQALSRSLFAAMVPKHKSAEFFGFFSTSAKFAGIVGPLMFGLASQLTGSSRLSILLLVVFFIIGGILLTQVNVKEGIRAARAAEAGH